MIHYTDKTIHLTDIVFPKNINHHETLFGGAALSYMDKIAFIAATRFGRRHFVTASCDNIDFKNFKIKKHTKIRKITTFCFNILAKIILNSNIYKENAPQA